MINFFLRLLGFVWSLPLTIVGVAFALACDPFHVGWRSLGNWGGWVIEVQARQ